MMGVGCRREDQLLDDGGFMVENTNKLTVDNRDDKLRAQKVGNVLK